MKYEEQVKAAKDKITEEAARGAVRAMRNPWKAAVVLMISHAVAFAIGVIFF